MYLVYGKQSCSNCETVKQMLGFKNIKFVYKSVQHFLLLIFVNCNLIDKGVQGAEPCNLRSKMYSRVSEGR